MTPSRPFKAALTYCKLLENGREIFEVDMLKAILKVDGKDKIGRGIARRLGFKDDF